MPARIFPNLGLKGGYDEHESGWADDMSLNLLILSVLSQGSVEEKVSAEPGAPAPGTVVILDETEPTNPNTIAVWEGEVGAETWTYIEPKEGWLLYNQDAGYYEKFDGTVWAELETGGGSTGGPAPVQTEAADYTVHPGDSGNYVRLTAAGTKDIDIAAEATTALPDDGEWHFRNVGAGDATIVPAGGVTVNPPAGGTLVIEQGMTVTLKRAAADVFDLLGQTVPV